MVLTLNRLRAAFKTFDITERDYLQYEELFTLVNKLGGTMFEEETFRQLWDECTLNSKGEARVGDFMDYIIKAQEILTDRLQQVEGEISQQYQLRKRQVVSQQNIDNLKYEKQQVQESLEIIRRPFGHYQPSPNKQPEQRFELVRANAVEQQQRNAEKAYPISSNTSEAWSWIIYIILCIGGINLVNSFYVNRFIDLLVCLLILSSFLFEAVSRITLKFSFYMVLLSFGYDIIWIVVYTRTFWYLGVNYDYATSVTAYLRLMVVLILISLLLKLPLGYLLVSQFEYDDQYVYEMRILGQSLVIQKQADHVIVNDSPILYALVEQQRPRQSNFE